MIPGEDGPPGRVPRRAPGAERETDVTQAAEIEATDAGRASGASTPPAALLVGDPSPMAMLGRFGPGSAQGEVSEGDAIAYARRLTRRTGENFSVLSRLVPEPWRDDFASVYAFCRWADDLADESGTGDAARQHSLDLLAWWRSGLEGCFAGEPSHPVYVALARAVRGRRLSPGPFHALIDAFEQDQRVTHYTTWDELMGYCRGSADPVGHLVLQIGGVRPPEEAPGNAELYQMSDAICSALQLTNHWQDVRRDLRERGRVYLPSSETGIGAEELRALLERGGDPRPDPSARVRYIKALRPLVDRTRELFRQGEALPGLLASGAAGEEARPLGRVVGLLAAGGRRVLERIESGGCMTLWRRPTIGKPTKLWLVCRHTLVAPRSVSR